MLALGAARPSPLSTRRACSARLAPFLGLDSVAARRPFHSCFCSRVLSSRAARLRPMAHSSVRIHSRPPPVLEVPPARSSFPTGPPLQGRVPRKHPPPRPRGAEGPPRSLDEIQGPTTLRPVPLSPPGFRPPTTVPPRPRGRGRSRRGMPDWKEHHHPRRGAWAAALCDPPVPRPDASAPCLGSWSSFVIPAATASELYQSACVFRVISHKGRRISVRSPLDLILLPFLLSMSPVGDLLVVPVGGPGCRPAGA